MPGAFYCRKVIIEDAAVGFLQNPGPVEACEGEFTAETCAFHQSDVTHVHLQGHLVGVKPDSNSVESSSFRGKV